MVTNFYHKATGPVFAPWTLPEGAVHPPAAPVGARPHPHAPS